MIARESLEETAVLLNSDLAAAKESLAKTDAELANVQRSLAELQVQHAAEAGARANRATVDSAKARLESAKAKQEEIQQQKLQTREAKSEGRLEVNGWRLSSGGCTQGPSAAGHSSFSVEPGQRRRFSEEFQAAKRLSRWLWRIPHVPQMSRPPAKPASTTSIPGRVEAAGT